MAFQGAILQIYLLESVYLETILEYLEIKRQVLLASSNQELKLIKGSDMINLA